MNGSSSSSSESASKSSPLVYRGQSPISPSCHNKKSNVVIIDTAVVPNRCFQHYFVEDHTEIEFKEGLQEIGEGAFSMCWALGNIRVPTSTTKIGKDAFAHCMLQIRSVELPPLPLNIGDRAFQGCARLRNVFVTKEQEGKHLFKGCHNLSTIFPDSSSMMTSLTQRFDGLPRHELCYYQSYYPLDEVLNKLKELSKEQQRQDCLGMTPLHILALSKVQRFELYQACLQECADDLISKDKWGALPIHYALENNVPLPIVQYLLQQQQRHFPNDSIHLDKFLLNHGVDFFQRASLPMVELLLDYHGQNCVQEKLDWDRILHDAHSMASLEVFQCVVTKRFVARTRALEWKPWRLDIESSISAISLESLQGECWTPLHICPRAGIKVVEQIQSQLATYEKRTIMALVELICWKHQMMISTSTSEKDSDIRTDCRIRSGAEYIVPLVLSFIPR